MMYLEAFGKLLRHQECVSVPALFSSSRTSVHPSCVSSHLRSNAVWALLYLGVYLCLWASLPTGELAPAKGQGV